MREFLLLPFYVAGGVLAGVAGLIAITCILLAVALVALLS